MNELLTALFWRQFWQITLLIPVAVMVVRYLIPRQPQVGYGLLLLVLLKAVFPPVWDFPTAIVWNWLPGHSVALAVETGDGGKAVDQVSKSRSVNDLAVSGMSPPLSDTVEVAAETPVEIGTPGQSSGSRLDWASVVSGVWVAGALCLLGYVIGKRVQLLKFHYDMQREPTDELLEIIEQVSEDLGLVHTPKVLVTQHPTVPFASGMIKPIVVLPSHLVGEVDAEELKLILAHELTHLRRGDTFTTLLQLTVQVVWWFHPLVYWLNYEVRRVREECCDADVVRQLKCPPASYARCLLNMLELHQRLRPATGMVGLGPFEVTAKRMQNIMRHPRRRWSRIESSCYLIGMGLFAITILPGTATSSITPKVIVGELVPEGAIVSSPAEESHTPPQQPPKKSRPKPPARNPDRNVTPEQQAPEAPPRIAIPADFSYPWVREDRHQYRVRLEAKHPTVVRNYEGTPTFRVDAVAAGRPALALVDATFSQQQIPREGVQVPTLPSLDDSSRDPYGFRPGGPRFRSPFSPFAETPSSASVPGSNGHFNPSSGKMPYLLGELKEWVFPEIHGVGEETERSRELTLFDADFVQTSPFQSQPQEKMTAIIRDRFDVASMEDDRVTLTRRWSLATADRVDGEPRREITLTGTVSLSAATRFPIDARYQGQLTEREPHREVRIPLLLETERKN